VWGAADLAATLCLCVGVTSIVRENDHIRWHWRTYLLKSRLVAFYCALLFLLWPSYLAFYGIAQSIANGFIDPALHVTSIRRNPSPKYKKFVFFVGKLLHHGGGMLVVGAILRPIIFAMEDRAKVHSAVDATIFQMQAPLLISTACQVWHWIEDVLVLQRKAPKWLRHTGLPVTVVQTASLVVLILFDGENAIPLVYTLAAIAGSSIDFVADFVGYKVSAYEVQPGGGTPSEGERGQMSVARVVHKNRPPGVDHEAAAVWGTANYKKDHYCKADSAEVAVDMGPTAGP